MSALHKPAPHKPALHKLGFVDHEDAAAGVAVFLDIDEGNDNAGGVGLRFFGEDLGHALGDLALLLGGAALQ